jgi:hypothetical protein
MGEASENGRRNGVRTISAGWEEDNDVAAPTDRRMNELMEEFRDRQRQRPDLVVRAWWTAVGGSRVRRGFVVEYCPLGRESVHLAVRGNRVTVDGPGGARDAALELTVGWILDGVDTSSPQTLANHLLRMADTVLGEPA